MALEKFIFRPGINREGTDYSNDGGWFDANLVRFRKGLPEKIGGWAKATLNTYQSTVRALHAWVDLSLTKYLGLGATWKYYVKEGDNFYDITPLRVTTAAGDVTFAATNGSSTITVTDTSHGAVTNDFVTFSGASTLGGNVTAAVLNQEYQILLVTGANTYTITAKDTSGTTVTANASDSGNGGSSVVGAYQINVGLDSFVESTGWGAGTWGAGTWGSATAITAANQLRLWSHDNFGEDLVMNVRAGGVYYFDTSAATLGTTRAIPLTSLAGANLPPTEALQVLVSDIDRHVVCLGADPISGSSRSGSLDPMLVAWSDQENAAVWEPLSTNTAGSFRLSAGSQIVGAVRARQETLIWTDTALYSMTFIGQPFTFGINLVNEGVGLISPNGAINTPKGIFWMDKKGFYTYNGAVTDIPCTVQNYVFSDFNEGQAFQVFGFVNKEFDEVGWFYCSSSSSVIDRYVVFNYEDKVWTIGQLTRSSWLDEGIFDTPMATYTTSNTGYLYNHETGNDDDGSPMDNVFIESSDFALGNGDQFQAISRIIPDVKFTGSGGSGQTINFVLKQRNYPGESLATDSTNTCTATTTKIDTRLRARQAALRIESDDDNSVGARLGVGFRVGATRMDLKVNGRR
jgi:hypothetical protein|tara:strand:+ start:4107 stop:5996 length:1890 start_codon:yes stop_codon:yes gene_type:complete